MATAIAILEIIDRHADFQSRIGSPEARYFNELPGRPLLYLHHCAQRCTADTRKIHAARLSLTKAESWLIDEYGPWISAIGPSTHESRHRAVQSEVLERFLECGDLHNGFAHADGERYFCELLDSK